MLRAVKDGSVVAGLSLRVTGPGLAVHGRHADANNAWCVVGKRGMLVPTGRRCGVIAMAVDTGGLGDDEGAARLYDGGDVAWIRGLLDVIEGAIGEPWRILLARIERAALGVRMADRMAMLGTLQRWLGGELISGEGLERRVALMSGRPPEAELAAFANLAQVQRWLRRARAVELRVWGDAARMAHVIAGLGLIAEARRIDDATVFTICGPVAMPHSLTLYGRALAELAGCLTMHARFTLEIVDGVSARRIVRCVMPPVLLPPACVPARPSAVDALANELGELGLAVALASPPIAVGEHVLYPQLALTDRRARWSVELIGFSTPDSLSTKLARYRAAGHPVVLCVEQAFAPGCDLTLGVCCFTHQVDARDVLAMVRA